MFLIEGDGKAVLYTGDIRCKNYALYEINDNRQTKIDILQLNHGGYLLSEGAQSSCLMRAD